MTNLNDVTGSSTSSVDVWHVRLANGETRALSLDELDAGFHDGWIDARTPVLAAGAIRWAPLGEVAGLDDEVPPPVPSVPYSIAPLALDNSGPDFALDVDFDAASDPDVLAFRPKRGKALFRILTALVVVAGLGFAAFRGKPLVQRALASRAAAASNATPAAVAVAPARLPIATTPPPAAPPAPVPAPEAMQAIATVSLTTLPTAVQTAEEKKAAAAEAKKAKRAPTKRAAK